MVYAVPVMTGAAIRAGAETHVTRIEFIKKAKTERGIASQVNLFPAPLLVFRWPEALSRRVGLIDAVAQRRATSPGLSITNVGGWHSATDLACWPEPDVVALVRWAAAMASRATSTWRGGATSAAPAEWRVMAWANVNPPGAARNRSHHHVNRNWNWSASYYLQLPPAPETAGSRGEIVFEDRRVGLDAEGAAGNSRREFRYAPSEGELVMFPSWLYHRVEPHDGEGDRISIAMNFHSPWLEPSRHWRYRKGRLWKTVPWLMRPLARLAGQWDQSDPGGPPGADITPDARYL